MSALETLSASALDVLPCLFGRDEQAGAFAGFLRERGPVGARRPSLILMTADPQDAPEVLVRRLALIVWPRHYRNLRRIHAPGRLIHLDGDSGEAVWAALGRPQEAIPRWRARFGRAGRTAGALPRPIEVASGWANGACLPAFTVGLASPVEAGVIADLAERLVALPDLTQPGGPIIFARCTGLADTQTWTAGGLNFLTLPSPGRLDDTHIDPWVARIAEHGPHWASSPALATMGAALHAAFDSGEAVAGPLRPLLPSVRAAVELGLGAPRRQVDRPLQRGSR